MPAVKVTVVIDVFRAFSSACYILHKGPKKYIYCNRCGVVRKFITKDSSAPVLIGKPEKGSSLNYDIPNSPTHILKTPLKNRLVVHRSEAGSQGILASKNADLILAVSFLNAKATVRYLKSLGKSEITFLPMGHEAVAPALEDDICALYLSALLEGKSFDLNPHINNIKKSSGKYFFTSQQWEYPKQDFERCLIMDLFNFAIEAQLFSDYCLLMPRKPVDPNYTLKRSKQSDRLKNP